jgi:hypothetical protein
MHFILLFLVLSEKARLIMQISGFSFGRNAVKLHYPVVEAIQSILPIVDEFVVAIGKGDDDDVTLESVRSIQSPKLKIIETVWDEKYCYRGAINAVQTDIAMKACTGDWLFYVQADEVVHEKYHPVILERCEQCLDDSRVEGLLFRYRHFWGGTPMKSASSGISPTSIRSRVHNHSVYLKPGNIRVRTAAPANCGSRKWMLKSIITAGCAPLMSCR